MADTHYLISDASRKVDVESHVLRYWEEELEMNIPRNEMDTDIIRSFISGFLSRSRS